MHSAKRPYLHLFFTPSPRLSQKALPPGPVVREMFLMFGLKSFSVTGLIKYSCFVWSFLTQYLMTVFTMSASVNCKLLTRGKVQIRVLAFRLLWQLSLEQSVF